MLMIFPATIIFTGLFFLKKYTDIGFVIAQLLACLMWIVVQFEGFWHDYFYEYVLLFTPVWLFLSIAAIILTGRKNRKS